MTRARKLASEAARAKKALSAPTPPPKDPPITPPVTVQLVAPAATIVATPPAESTEALVARLVAEGLAKALPAQEAALKTLHAQTGATHLPETPIDETGLYPNGFHDVVVQKSNPNYASPLAKMLHMRSFVNPARKLYAKVLDGETDEGMARLEAEELVLLRMSNEDYDHLLKTNAQKAHGIENAVSPDEQIKKVPLAL